MDNLEIQERKQNRILVEGSIRPQHPQNIQARWTRRRVLEVIRCLRHPQLGKNAVFDLPWYTHENGFNRNEFYARGERLDLRGIRIEDMDISGIDLEAVRLDGARLVDVDLSGTTLKFVKWSRCHMTRVDLSGADLTMSDLSHGHLFSVNLSGADLSGAQLFGSTLNGINLRGTRCYTCNFAACHLQTIDWNSRTDFAGANLHQTNMTLTPVLKRYIEDQRWLADKQEQMNRTTQGKILWRLWGWSSLYGQSLLRWSAVCLGVVFLYSVIYLTLLLDINPQSINPFLSSLYLSLVAFTSLGFGEFPPPNNLTALVVMSEVTLGYLGFGMLVAILADKVVRRS